MQLVEQGKLDLEADINSYLDFRIPDTYPQPVTLKHLMTHTAGFEDLFLEIFVWDADDLMPVGEWLASHIPARVRPPGEVAAYSNYGANLAGYIVARVSGLTYEQYIQEHILDTLGMLHSTVQVPVPPDLRAHASLGYWEVDGVLQPVPDYPEYFGQAAMMPAGGHSSSITDMAHFMIAHLQDGHYSGADITDGRILKESTMQQMHSTLYAPAPRLLGNAYGFFEFSDNGQRTLGHSGDTIGFRTLLLLLPEQNLGIFVAYNSEGSAGLETQHNGFQRAFFDHYYPAPSIEPIQPPADFAERAGRFVGSYRITRSAYTTFEKYKNLMSPVEISDLGNGTLLFTIYGLEIRLVEVEPLYFRQPDGQLGIVFREDDRGRITHMFTDLAPQFAFEKLNWYETPRFNMALALVCILVFLSMIPVILIRAIRNRRSDGDRKPASRGARAAYWTILGISVLNLLFVSGTVLVLFGSLGFPMFGVPLTYRIVLGLGVLAAVLTVGALVYTVLAWKDHYWGIAGRAYYTLVTVAAVGFVWFLNYWNLLGWQF
jgi:CubicO group peptidase (beta-lactamase class C family)